MESKQQPQLFKASRQVRHSWFCFCLWAIFTAGLLIQMATPRLKIENRAFVMPPISDSRGPVLRPDLLVRRERWMQFFSGIFTVGGAIALGVYYRRNLVVALKG